jgi:hypothetical protein
VDGHDDPVAVRDEVGQRGFQVYDSLFGYHVNSLVQAARPGNRKGNESRNV